MLEAILIFFTLFLIVLMFVQRRDAKRYRNMTQAEQGKWDEYLRRLPW